MSEPSWRQPIPAHIPVGDRSGTEHITVDDIDLAGLLDAGYEEGLAVQRAARQEGQRKGAAKRREDTADENARFARFHAARTGKKSLMSSALLFLASAPHEDRAKAARQLLRRTSRYRQPQS
jgi:hypothetical protein